MVSAWIYNRTVSIRRQAQVTAVGNVGGYGGTRQTTETVVATGIKASIQGLSTGSATESNLPGQPYGRGRYHVFIRETELAKGMVKRSDIVVDDLGLRYQVSVPYHDNFGFRLECELVGT